VLALLVDKSIVQPEQEPGQTRFHLLETIRQYGLAKLRAAGGVDAVRELHRDHYLRLAEQCRRDWDRGSGQAEAYARTRPEHANLRSALEFSLSTPGQEAIGLRLAVALHYFWLFCGHAAEGRRWLERALQLNPGPSRDRANALWITAFALSRMGYAATIYSYSREAESWARENGDDDVLAHALLVLGGYYFLGGEIEKSAPLFHQAMSRLEALGETSSFLLQLHSAAAQAESWQGQVHEGLAIAARGLELCDVTGEQYARSALLFASALSHWMLGEYEEAVKGVTEGIRLAQTFNDVLGAVTRMELLCWTTAAMRHFVRAAELLGVAQELWAMGGGRSMLGSLQMTDAHDTCEREVLEALGPQRYQEAFNRGVAAGVEFNQAITFAVGPVATDARPADAVRSAGSRRPGSLSEREYQVAELVAQGLTNKEIAQQLVISRRTAESHVVHILDKLGFSSRSQIATWLTTHQL
jgi:DNA-binding CsgD family transcriptional regulator